ncbi:MAG: ABC transporter ATP-binding protein/permease [Lachnospiraceae bacterium]|nr:ABC transporter ATP-binding protein/permease [Lachnospiraceae bacterium]
MGRGFPKYLAAILIMSLSVSGFDTVTAFLLGNLMTRASRFAQGNIFDGLFAEAVLSISVGIMFLIVYALSFRVYMMEAKKGGANLQRLLYSKCMRLPYSYYDNTHSGEFMSKIIYDGERAQGIYGSRFRRILMPAVMTLFYLGSMFLLSWQLTICLFAVSLILFAINGAFIIPMQRMSTKMSKTNASITEQISNILSGMEQIRIFQLRSLMVERYIENNEHYKKEQGKVNVMSAALDGLNQGFELIGSLVFIALGIFFVGIGITSIGNLAAVYVLYFNMSWNMLQVGLYIPSMASYLANAKRVFEFLDREEEQQERRISQNDNQGNLSFPELQRFAVQIENVSFSYDGRQPVLQNFNLNIEKGKCVAIKGESGKGKSTIAKLLLGFYTIDAGNILLNGKDFKTYSLREIRELIGYVPQEPYLYNVSIEDNIRYGRPDANHEEIVRAAQMANAHEFILALESGYETKAGERGNRLSGGQRQRIAIARAILKDAPILILDEATSALDNKSEQLVNEALHHLMEGRTTIVIAHRQSTLEQADEMIEI